MMEEMYRQLQAGFASDLPEKWRVRLEEYPEILKQVLADLTEGATQGKRLVRVTGQSGSGKTTRLVPEAERRFAEGAKPILVSAAKLAEYHPYKEALAAEYGEENVRRKTDDFASMMMFLLLPELIKAGYDIILDVAMLGEKLEEILVEWLGKAGYEMVILVAAVSPEVSGERLEKRAWRHEEKVEKAFLGAMRASLEFYAQVLPEVETAVYSEEGKIYEGEMRGAVGVWVRIFYNQG